MQSFLNIRGYLSESPILCHDIVIVLLQLSERILPLIDL